MIEAGKEDEVVLKKVPYIHYTLYFRKNKENKMQALIDLGSEVNAMTLIYAAKLGLKICHINVEAQKINNSTFKTFGIVLASFQVEDKQGWA